jgi:putative PIN family toxin of toxin-antitoxin system
VPNIVLDTNALVSAFIAGSSDAVGPRVLRLARERFTLCLSDAIETELRGVLNRPKFRRYGASPARVAVFVDGLVAAAQRVTPTERITDCRDPADNMVLEAAVAGGVAIIVTGDADLRILHPWRGIDILPPADFLRRFGIDAAPA